MEDFSKRLRGHNLGYVIVKHFSDELFGPRGHFSLKCFLLLNKVVGTVPEYL